MKYAFTNYCAHWNTNINKHTIKQFIDENKIILNVFLCQFSEVGLHDLHNFEEKLKDHGSVDILPRDCSYPNIATLCVKEARSCDVGYRTTHQATSVDDVHTKCVDAISPNRTK